MAEIQDITLASSAAKDGALAELERIARVTGTSVAERLIPTERRSAGAR